MASIEQEPATATLNRRQQLAQQPHYEAIDRMQQRLFAELRHGILPPPDLVEVVVSQFNVTAEEEVCCICLEDYSDVHPMICKMNCNHTVCMPCAKRMLKQSKLCPLCREPIAQIRVECVYMKLQIDSINHPGYMD